ncbi:hypothetical protein HPP92_006368 [Vanilla planifolia]|uniref:Uncharacterized protein n=1 Tax=Vanilla planifolia TaxID=51239 RepID=A0A835VA80_VANPL|nr:hypothetical protein HPP92_006368 [Vanilla planifolia]
MIPGLSFLLSRLDSEIMEVKTESPPPSFSFHSHEEQSISSVDLTKKRKLQNESFTEYLPSPKQRLRVDDDVFRNGQQQPEIVSQMDSNSFTGDKNDASDAEGTTTDTNSVTQSVYSEQPSTSSLSSCNDGALKIHFLSSECRCLSELNKLAAADLSGETLQLHSGFMPMEECAETDGGRRRQTIDKEFEEYFSSLLL